MATRLNLHVRNTSLHGNFEFNVHRGKTHLGTLQVDNYGIVWADSYKQKGVRILWRRLKKIVKEYGYKVKR